MARLVVVFLTVFLLMHTSEMSLTSSTACDHVNWDFTTCLRYLAGYESDPTKHCCESLGELNMEAEKQNTKDVCRCIGNLATDIGIRFDDSRIGALPHKCHTPIIFPISDQINCSS
ncbi:hypothetical protein RJT34_28944 [Clitoria ternatea]|uniref:Bifunctional inhibitor/plant lipid transfer protein/seed storage helical domain-containing protein n=1 Tax=Clitoria ternatea TaxID=43366 RepID=A0AAN9IAL9_CLITE